MITTRRFAQASPRRSTPVSSRPRSEGPNILILPDQKLQLQLANGFLMLAGFDFRHPSSAISISLSPSLTTHRSLGAEKRLYVLSKLRRQFTLPARLPAGSTFPAPAQGFPAGIYIPDADAARRRRARHFSVISIAPVVARTRRPVVAARPVIRRFMSNLFSN